ncbi:ASCH domain-containing protein [Photobacterium leiognathi]|uniref:ASCH domain-containing protein n=1 Tax=Photobacterium leiognathi TaxID=553611 RepID=UPI001EDDEAF1|nr:ASCH domain-containing protein [Photobacterium leiognathi]MCG3884079.1 ASCH domain-containing protein [Photobacterium leiognathi]
MKAIPMTFTSEMVNALLSGRKTVTRRPIKSAAKNMQANGVNVSSIELLAILVTASMSGLCATVLACGTTLRMKVSSTKRLVKKGDYIYVRETWGAVSHAFDENNNIKAWLPDRPATPIKELRFGKGFYSGHAIYRADGSFTWTNDCGDEITAWHPSIHMPRKVSRLTLRVTDVRVERVQDITEEQATQEGLPLTEEHQQPQKWFKNLWNSIYDDWDKKTFTWVIEFEVFKENVDNILESN